MIKRASSVRPLLLLCSLWLAACGGRPTRALTEAEGAVADARLARKCAPEEYAAARRMLNKAKALADKGENGEAEQAAKAAKKLALKARNKAMLRREECEKESAVAEPGGLNADDFVEKETGPTVALTPDGRMQTIYFDYNTFDLTPEARETLNANASWLKHNPRTRVVIEGHCDKRGSTEYNLALGEKRGQVVRRYLRSLGVPGDRLTVISYGEESPVDYGETEAAFAKNRRAEFRVR